MDRHLKAPSINALAVALIALAVSLLALAPAFAAPVAESPVDETGRELKTLRGGWYLWDPYQFVDKSTGAPVLTGLDVESTRAVAKAAGYAIALSYRPWQQHIAQMREGQADIASGMTKTPERAEFLHFSRPYRQETNVLYVPAGQSAQLPFASAAAMVAHFRDTGFRLGVVQGFAFADPAINAYIADPRNAEFVPAGQCLGCHQPQKQGGAVATLGYEAACAGCHDQGIARRDLVVMRWPELEPAPQAPEACGPPGDAPDPSPVSLDPANALLAFLLGAAADDQAAYADPLRKLADAMVAKGAEPIAALAAGRLGGDGARLLRGLSGETARMAACAWASNREHEPPGGATQPGWRAEGLEIRYARPAHGDPVVRAWLDAIAASPRPADDDDAERLEAVRAEILGADGPGQCLKCHAISGPADGPRTIAWNRSPAPQRQLHRFDHRPHVAAMPGAGSCASCHLQGDKPASSGFVPVGIEACTSCHQQGKAPDGCLTCHAYHQNHALKPRMTKDAR